jgi:hypothetical protein
MWYEATVEKVLSEEEALEFAANDMRNAQARLLVRFKAFSQKQTVPLDYLRLTE